MNWRNLLTLNCPACGSKLSIGMLDDAYKCKCEFSISEKRLEEIVKDMQRPRSKRERSIYDNELSLNNFGHAIPSKDFSDEIATRL